MIRVSRLVLRVLDGNFEDPLRLRGRSQANMRYAKSARVLLNPHSAITIAPSLSVSTFKTFLKRTGSYVPRA